MGSGSELKGEPDLVRGAGGHAEGQETAEHGEPAEAEARGDASTDSQGSVFRCIGYCEVDKNAVQIYDKNFGESHQPTDARKLDAGSLPDFDLLCAGFPCQSFSLAGKRRGLQDTRGTLFFEIARIAEVRRPRLLLLENVKGLLSHDEGRTFGTILARLDEVGYDAEWEVLNSKHYGVPQNRERVFIVGHLRGEPWREVFPLGQGIEISLGPRPEAQGGGEWVRGMVEGKSPGVKARGVNIYDDYNQAFTELVGAVRPTSGNEAAGNGVKVIGRTRDHEKGREMSLHEKDELGTLKQPSGNQEDLLKVGATIRRLTPVECERLQGFPDGWTAGVSDTSRYRMMGNAVTTNVIEAIGRKILAVSA